MRSTYRARPLAPEVALAPAGLWTADGVRSVACRPMAIERVGIIGSGIMGSGIAEVAAKAGHEVVLRSRSRPSADAMVTSLEKSLAKQVERGKLDDKDAKARSAGSPPPPTSTTCTPATS